MRIEGRFVGNFAEDARSLVARSGVPSRLTVDLSEMTYVDDIGEQVLSWLKQIGVKFSAETAYSRDVCERLDLALARRHAVRPHAT